MIKYFLKPFECGMCGFTSRIDSRVRIHVKEFPNCAFTEESFIYLSKQPLLEKVE